MKTFVARAAFLKKVDNSCVGAYESNRHSQGDIFVKAKNKTAALELLKSLDYRITPAELRVAMGNDMDALEAAEVITDAALTIVPSSQPYLVATVGSDENGARTVATVGEIVFDDTSHKMVFVAV